MNKKVRLFLIMAVCTIFFGAIALLVAIRLVAPVPFTPFNEVAEKDWQDNWEKESIKKQSARFELFKKNSGVYIIHNFFNNQKITSKSIEKIDSIKIAQNSPLIFFKFLWNGKYNHDWRVEYVNQKYVDEISSLFSVQLVYPEIKGEYLFEDIHLYPALEKKHKKIHFTIEGNKLMTNYPNGFDFFMWKDLQDTTKTLHQERQIDSFILTNERDRKKIATIRWESNGYRLYF